MLWTVSLIVSASMNCLSMYSCVVPLWLYSTVPSTNPCSALALISVVIVCSENEYPLPLVLLPLAVTIDVASLPVIMDLVFTWYSSPCCFNPITSIDGVLSFLFPLIYTGTVAILAASTISPYCSICISLNSSTLSSSSLPDSPSPASIFLIFSISQLILILIYMHL